jgi:predicted DNA-binding transcriptional regulator YafY
VRIQYRSGDGIHSDRTVQIRGLTMERSLTLLHCQDLELGERRTFRLDRIARVTAAAGASTPPRGTRPP